MSIDRVGSFAYSQYLFAQMQKAENALETTNRQVATGKVADTYYGYSEKTAVMEAARSAGARADANVAAAQQASARLDLQDTLLSQLSDLADQVRQALTKAAADQDATSLMTTLQGYFSQAVDILNSKDANGYTFGGDNNQTPPVTVTTLDDLAALPSIASAFANGNEKTSVRIGENRTVQVGMLASDIGSQLLSLFQQVAQYDASVNGPINGKTTLNQQSFLESTIQTAADAATDVNNHAAANGIRYQGVQSAIAQLQASSSVYQSFVSDIQDVDVAQALAKLNQNQVALQATFQMTSKLNQLSLLDYLPL